MEQNSSKISQLLIFFVVMILISAGYFLPFGQWGWFGGVLKGLLFIATGIAIYWSIFGESALGMWLNRESGDEGEESHESLEHEPPQESSWSGFGNAFAFYQNRTLALIQQSLVAEQTAFYMIRNGRPVFESGLSSEGFQSEPCVVSDDALVSQVIEQKTAVLKDALPDETYCAGFESAPIKSFLGVPLLMGEECLGVLAVCSQTAAQFGEADSEILSQYAELMLQVMTLCHRGLHWEMDQEVYRVHLDFEKQLESALDEGQVMSAFLEQIKRLFPFDRFTLCRRAGQEGEIRFIYGQVDHLEPGTRFPLDGGLNGWLIKRNAPLIIQDIEEGRYIRPRYHADEDSKHGIHSFLGIPLNGGRENAWGCISLESKNSCQYTAKAKDVLSILAIPLQLALERIPGSENDTGNHEHINIE